MPDSLLACDFCMSYAQGGEVVIRRDSREAEQAWTTVRTLEAHALCELCFGDAVRLIDAAAGPNESRPSGAPLSIAQGIIDAERCDLCGSALKNESYTLEMVPNERVFVRRDMYHHLGRMRQLRLCFGCFAWFHSVIYDETGARGGSLTGERTGPTWLPEHFTDAYSVFLGPEDTALLRMAVEQAGRRFTALRPRDARSAATTGDGLVFAGAGPARLAGMLLESLTAHARQRMVVVSRLDALVDMSAALRSGAVDFLVSPLSAQQVSGAFERIADLRGSPTELHRRSGLWLLKPSCLRSGEPCQAYRIAVATPTDRMQVAWMLRRFLRGYDRVGSDRDGTLQAHVFCPDEHVDEVVRRLSYILGDRARVTFEGRVESAGSSAPPAPPQSA